MSETVHLQPGKMYHIYNRGNNREDIFREESNYALFLKLYEQHIHSIADTFAYCLMKNHFHMLVRMKNEEDFFSDLPNFYKLPAIEQSHFLSQKFSNFFNAYTKTTNASFDRTGALFHRPFQRKEVTRDNYLSTLIFYIHFNPQKHGFLADFRNWKWSSYHTLIQRSPTKLKRDEVLDWFDGRENFMVFHQGVVEEKLIANALIENVELDPT